ncbi:hypothetical protein AVEN_149005-1 [Araneus ventricosus]|uniref:Uncharacterized protein n=1 Tax=Araneus ventricosus TaxID=182803 RepID=A0A4Y2VIJ9_ARAVE|nr:hypothetical protein AVEN_149005-1 [Araneus ventricosus]
MKLVFSLYVPMFLPFGVKQQFNVRFKIANRNSTIFGNCSGLGSLICLLVTKYPNVRRIQDLTGSLEAERLEKNNLQQRVRELEALQAPIAADPLDIAEDKAPAAEGAVEIVEDEAQEPDIPNMDVVDIVTPAGAPQVNDDDPQPAPQAAQSRTPIPPYTHNVHIKQINTPLRLNYVDVRVVLLYILIFITSLKSV